MQSSVQKIFFQKSLCYSFLEVALKSRCGGKRIKNKYCFKVVEIWVFLFLLLYIFQVFYNVCTITMLVKITQINCELDELILWNQTAHRKTSMKK